MIYSNIEFTIESEQNNAFPFLGILVTRNQNNTFMTSIYRKKTFTGLYTKWDSFTPRKYKRNLIRSLIYRYYRLCSSGSLLQSALNDLRKLLLQNGYPRARGGGGGYLTKFNTGRLRPEVQTLTLLYTILAEKVPLLYTFY